MAGSNLWWTQVYVCCCDISYILKVVIQREIGVILWEKYKRNTWIFAIIFAGILKLLLLLFEEIKLELFNGCCCCLVLDKFLTWIFAGGIAGTAEGELVELDVECWMLIHVWKKLGADWLFMNKCEVYMLLSRESCLELELAWKGKWI